MKEMAKIPGLRLRGKTWELRVRVPKDLLSAYKKNEIIRSLKTRDYNEARNRVHIERASIQSDFEQKRHQHKAGKENPDMLSGYDDHQMQGLALRWFVDTEKRGKENLLKDNATLTPEEKKELIQELKQYVQWAHDETLGTREGNIHDGMTNAANFLKKSGITYNRRSEAFKKLSHLFSKSAYELAQKDLRQWQGKPYQATDPMFTTPVGFAVPNASGAGIKKKMNFRTLLEEYMQDPSQHRCRSTKDNYKIIHRALEEIVGADKFVHEITRDDVKKIRDLLLKVPAHSAKFAPKKTLREACKLAAEKGWKLISPATVNSYLSKLSAVLGYAKREKYVYENEALKITVHDEVDAKDKRLPFEPAELKKIFSAPLYLEISGNKDQRAITQFWIPLIALFTGMRLNEICQLELTDIAREDDVDVILIRRKTKTKASVRTIPVHPELKKIGFMDYVARMKDKGNTRLFPDLQKDVRGYDSSGFSKWFNRTFLNSIEIKRPKIAFHSFRHNFRDAQREAELSYEVVGQLGGWTNEEVRNIYGKGLTVVKLFNAMQQIKYNLDLSHLYRKKVQLSAQRTRKR
jgi:integrase